MPSLGVVDIACKESWSSPTARASRQSGREGERQTESCSEWVHVCVSVRESGGEGVEEKHLLLGSVITAGKPQHL